MLVGFGSLHRQFPHDSGQNFAVLIQYGVPDVGPFFKLRVSLILGTKQKKCEKRFISLTILEDSGVFPLTAQTVRIQYFNT